MKHATCLHKKPLMVYIKELNSLLTGKKGKNAPYHLQDARCTFVLEEGGVCAKLGHI